MPELTLPQIQFYGLWLQSGAIVFSLLGIIFSIRATRRIARRRATLDILLEEQSNEFLFQSRLKFIALRDAGHLVKWAAPDNAASEEQGFLRAALNRYETIAVGIAERTMDEGVFRRYGRSTLVKDWCACKPWVIQMRQNLNVPAYYCEIEKLAQKWATKAEREHC
jgi:hypothetical protein